MAGPAHLVKRFFGSLLPVGPTATDEEWSRSQLLPGEQELWGRLSHQDRRHAAGVARRVQQQLGADAPRPVMAAALLHDVGKLDSGLGTFGRVGATLCGKVAGHEMAEPWSRRRGFTRRVGLYLRHDELGATLLEMAGSDTLTVAWAREHHRSPQDWSLPEATASALKDADDD